MTLSDEDLRILDSTTSALDEPLGDDFEIIVHPFHVGRDALNGLVYGSS